MKDIIVEKMEKEIENLLEELTKVDPSSKDYEDITSRLETLTSIIHKGDELEISEFKIRVERENKNDENLTRLKELKQEQLWNGVKTGVEIIGVVAPLVFYGLWMKRGLKFEEEGTFTSTTFKGLVSKFKPTK